MFEMTPEHMARTLLVAKGRERERCIKILEGMLDDPKLPYNRVHREALAEGVKRLRMGDDKPRQEIRLGSESPDEYMARHEPVADGLPAEREIPDDDEAVFLARRFGQFGGQG